MSSINRARKLQILYFSRKTKKLKNFKNGKKFLALNPHLYILLEPSTITQSKSLNKNYIKPVRMMS